MRRDRIHNQITGGIFFSAVIQGRDITVQLPPQVTPALSGLPAGSAAFTGRDGDLRVLLDALAPRPAGNRTPTCPSVPARAVAAVSGLAGVGKTELAVQAARTALARGWFPGGVLFVDLFGYDPARRVEPGQALDGLLRAMGIPGEHIPSDVQDRARLYASVLAAYAAEARRILVIVDNACTDGQARPIMPADDATGAIVTSRHTLGLLGARLLDLNVLARGDAVELVHRALNVAHPGDTRVAGNPDDAARIADLCGGLPLALQIIAALLAEDPARPLAAMAADLSDAATRLEDLRYADVAVRAAFDLSYQRLDTGHARMFRLLSANPGPDISTPATAVLVGENEASARRGLEALARAHLIEHGGSYGRWRMHDLVHLFADERGRAEGEQDGRAEAFSRLLIHYRTATLAADAHLNPAIADPAASEIGSREQALAWLDTEYPNLAAAAYAAAGGGEHAAIARDLPLGLARFLEWRRLFNDWITLSTSAMHAARRLTDRRGEGAALNNLGNALRGVRRFEEAITALQAAAQIFRDTGDQNGEGMALNNLGIALNHVRRFEEAITALQAAAQLYRDTGDQNGEARSLNNLGDALQGVQRFDEAITALQAATQIFRDTGDQNGEGISLNSLGNALRQLSQFEEAITAHQAAAQIYRDTGDRHGEGIALNSLGIALRKARRFDEAITALQAAAQIFRDTGDQNGEGIALNSLGNALRKARRFDEAITALQAAAQAFRDTGDQNGEGIAMAMLARTTARAWIERRGEPHQPPAGA